MTPITSSNRTESQMATAPRKYRRPSLFADKSRACARGIKLWFYRKGQMHWVQVQVMSPEGRLSYCEPLVQYTIDGRKNLIKVLDVDGVGKIVSVTYAPAGAFDLRKARRVLRRMERRRLDLAALSAVL